VSQPTLFEDVQRLVLENLTSVTQFLDDLVLLESPSRNVEALNLLANLITERFHMIPGCSINRQAGPLGPHIRFQVAGSPRRVLLLGHMDTAYKLGTLAVQPYRRDAGFIYGPGVSDMKAGLALIWGAFRILTLLDGDIPTLDALFTPDEEAGSPTSRDKIEALAHDADAVFNFEAGRPDGSVVIARKGAAHLAITTHGKLSHGGFAIEQGINAIVELSHKVIQLSALTDLALGKTVNIGVIQGGDNTNTVPDLATARFHAGFWKLDDWNAMLDTIRSISQRPALDGAWSELSGGLSFIPMERTPRNQHLYERVCRAAHLLDMPAPSAVQTPGASDAGFASLHAPTLCGMGPIGGGWHSRDEYLVESSVPTRLALLIGSVLLTEDELS
jgi:glutamate carboxypeptidase